MIEWTTVLSAIAPAAVVAVVVIIIALLFRRHITKINTRWGSATLNSAAGVAPAYLIELVWEVVEILEGRAELRQRRRTVIRRHVQQWRHNVSVFISEELNNMGATADGLWKNPVYRYLMAVMDALAHEIVGLTMKQMEANGFDELNTESDRDQYVRNRVDELQQSLIQHIQTDFIVSENALITQPNVLHWLSERAPLTEALWGKMYRELISVTMQVRSRLKMEVDRITTKGSEFGLTENEIDQIRKYMDRKLEESL